MECTYTKPIVVTSFPPAANSIEVDPRITSQGDLEVHCRLLVPIVEPLSFILRYMDTSTRALQEQTVNGNFINRDSITITVQGTELPFDSFQLQLAMLVQGIRGQFTQPSNVLGMHASLLQTLYMLQW